MKYLVKFKPLEPYTFGTEQTFDYPSDDEKTGKESYFVLSRTVPTQTTILGALRYLALKKKDLLHTDFHYPDLQEIQKTIGSKSFCFESETVQDFGVIHSVSPLFLLRAELDGENILIRNPFHNSNRKRTAGYQPMRMMKRKIWTSHGEISLPDAGEYDAKKGYAGGYIDIKNKMIYQDLFQSVMLPGNQKSSGDDERAYYRRQMICLNSDCCFAVYVDADEDAFPLESISYMGQKRAAFRVTAEPSDAESIETQVREAFADDSETPWFYALSPLWVPPNTDYSAFCIVEELSQRQLITNYREKRHVRKLRRSAVRYHLIQAGSVFYDACPLNLGRENCRNIGYNSVVQLGGKLL